MRTVDALELAGDVLPRRWVRWMVLLLLAGMLVTHNYSPLMWFVTAKAAAIQEDVVRPMLDSLLANLSTPTPAPRSGGQ